MRRFKQVLMAMLICSMILSSGGFLDLMAMGGTAYGASAEASSETEEGSAVYDAADLRAAGDDTAEREDNDGDASGDIPGSSERSEDADGGSGNTGSEKVPAQENAVDAEAIESGDPAEIQDGDVEIIEDADDGLEYQEIKLTPEQAPLYKEGSEERKASKEVNAVLRFWKALTGRRVENKDNDKTDKKAPVRLVVSGNLPKGATAEASYIEFGEEGIYNEQILTAFDIMIYDKAGNPYIPDDSVTVTVSGRSVKSAVKKEAALQLYSYATDAERRKDYSKKYDKKIYAADVLVFRDRFDDDKRLEYKPYDKKKKYKDGADAVRYYEDETGLVYNDDGKSVMFDYIYGNITGKRRAKDEIDATLNFVLSQQLPENVIKKNIEAKEKAEAAKKAEEKAAADVEKQSEEKAAAEPAADIEKEKTEAAEVSDKTEAAGSDGIDQAEPVVGSDAVKSADEEAGKAGTGEAESVKAGDDKDGEEKEASENPEADEDAEESDGAIKAAEAEPKQIERVATDGKTYRISAVYETGRSIPENAILEVKEIRRGELGYNSFVKRSAEEIGKKPVDLSFVKAFDITFKDPVTGMEYQPDDKVKINIELLKDEIGESGSVDVVHFGDKVEVMDTDIKDGTVEFETDGFSVFVVAGYTVEAWYRDSKGDTWKITAKFGPDTGLPDDVQLKVRELDSKESKQYKSAAAQALGKEKDEIAITKAFDIGFEKGGKTYHKLDGDVEISVELLEDKLNGETGVVHFSGENSDKAEKIDSETEGNTVSFASDEFSIYLITDDKIMHTYNFYAGGSLVTSIGVEDGQTLLPPQDPYDETKGRFVAWYSNEAMTELFTFTNEAETVTENKTINVYGKYDGVLQARFLTLPDENSERRTVSVERAENGTLDLSKISCPSPDGYMLVGWSETHPEDTNGYGTDITDYYNADSTITVNRNMTLYPIFREFHWVYFHGNGGLIPYNGENVPMVTLRVTTDHSYAQILSMIGTPERRGFTNGNTWYDTEPAPDGSFIGNPFVFDGRKLDRDLNFYAKWTPNSDPVPVTIYYWKENVDPDTYTLFRTRTEQHVPGTQLTLDNYGKGTDYNTYVTDNEVKTYFYRAHVTSGGADTGDVTYAGTTSDSSVKASVAGDGSTVINVWFDRKIYKLSFTYETSETDTVSYVRYGDSLENVWPSHDPDDHINKNSSNRFLGFELPDASSAYYRYPNVTDRILGTPKTSGTPAEIPSSWISSTSTKNPKVYSSSDYYSNKIYYGTQEIKAKYGNSSVKNYAYHYYEIPHEYTASSNSPIYPSESNVTPIFTNATSINLRDVTGYELDTAKIGENNTWHNTQHTSLEPKNSKYRVYYKAKFYNVNFMDGETLLGQSRVQYTAPMDAAWVKLGNVTFATLMDPSSAEEYVRALYTENGITEPAEHMEFLGWYTDRDFDVRYDPYGETMPSGDLVLYANWRPKAVHVTVDKNNVKNTTATGTLTDPPLNQRAGVVPESVRYLNYTKESGKYRATEHVATEYLPVDWIVPRYSTDDALNERYVFQGWQYKDSNGRWQPYDVSATVNDDVELRANWFDMSRVTIRYWEPDGDGFRQIDNLDMASYLEEGSATAKGYNRVNTAGTFRYWYVKDADPSVSANALKPGDSFTVQATTEADSDRYMDLYAYFTPGSNGGDLIGTYTFKLPPASGTAISDWTDHYVAKISAGEALPEPKTPVDPTGQNRPFHGWYKNTEYTTRFNDFSVPINNPSDTVLYACFEPFHTVTYYKDNTKSVVLGAQSYLEGRTISTRGVVYPLDTYHRVDHWYEIGDTSNQYHYDTVTDKTMPARDLELAPEIVEQEVLTFDSTGGSPVSPVAIPANRLPAAPTPPTRSHYIFDGWYTAAEGGTEYAFDNVTPLPSGVSKLYAHWKPDTSDPITTKFTIAYWAQNADNTEYDLVNSVEVSNVSAGSSYTRAQAAAAAGFADEAAMTDVSNLTGITASERQYFNFVNATGSNPVKTSDSSVTVAENGSTVMNLYFDRIRYTARFNAEGETITYNGQTYTGTQYSFTAWYGMPLPERWPIPEHSGNPDAKITWNHHTDGFSGWKQETSNRSHVTIPAVFANDMADRAAGNNGVITFNLYTISTTDGTNILVHVRYHFDDTGNGTYTVNENYNQDIYLTNNIGLTEFSAKQFAGYNMVNGDGNKTLTGTIKYAYYFKNTTTYYKNYNYSWFTYSYSNPIVGIETNNDSVQGSGYRLIAYDNTYVGSNQNVYYGTSTTLNTVSASSVATEKYHPDSDITVNFYYTVHKGTLTLKDSATGNTIHSYTGNESVPYNALISPYLEGRTPTAPAGKRFAGWSTSDKVKALVPENKRMPDVAEYTLYAWWEDADVTVTTVGRDETGAVTTDEEHYYSDTKPYNTQFGQFALPDPRLELGQVFLGWYREGDSSQALISRTTNVTENLRVMPKIRVETTVRVTYNANFGGDTGTGTAPTDSKSYAPNASAVVLPGTGLTKTDDQNRVHTFVSWNTAENGTGDRYYPGDTVKVPEGGLTLYAQYVGTREVTLIYDLNDLVEGVSDGTANFNGSDGLSDDIETSGTGSKTYRILFKDYDEDATHSHYPNTPYTVGTDRNGDSFTASRTNYAFIEWNTAKDGSGLGVLPGQKIRVDTLEEGGNTLYAIWGICKVVDKNKDEHVFDTIQKAVNFVNTTDLLTQEKTGTVEMLIDYKMYESFAVTIPEGCDVTLTTAAKSGSPKFTGEKYFYRGSGTIATITQEMTNKNMFTVSGDFKLKSITLNSDRNIVHSKGIILSKDAGNVTLDAEATIKDTHVEEGTSQDVSGGAIRSTGTGTITIKSDGLITNCWARDGGAIFLEGGGTLNMENGAVISDCQSYYWGGAVQVRKGTANLSDGVKIENCEAGTELVPTQQGKSPDGKGGAVYVNQEGGAASLNVEAGAEIKNCKAGNHGGAIYADVPSTSGCSFSFAGTVDGCEAPNYGGGIYIHQGNVSMIGGEIKNCSSTYGAGIYQNTGTLTANGISIHDNVASDSGGGIYSKNTLTLTDSTVTACKAVTAGGGIYRSNNNSGAVTLSGSSKIEGCYAGMGGGIYADKDVNLFTAGTAIKECAAKDVTIGSDGVARVADTVNDANLGGGVFQNAATMHVYNEAGTEIEDCEAYNGGGIYTKGHLYLGKKDNDALYGSITGCSAVNGAGVYQVQNNFYIYGLGVEISNNTSSEKGGGVYHEGGDFRVQNGSVKGNKAKNGGGIYVANGTSSSSVVQMQVFGKGSITENEALLADAGGGIEAGGEYVQLLFSGSAKVKDNNNATTKNNAERFCNVYLNRDSNNIIRTHNQLEADAYIGVYAADTVIDGETTVFTEHGEMGDPFGYRRHASNLKCFINDRNPLLYGTKGADNNTIYWSTYVCKITDPSGHLLYKDEDQKKPAIYEELGYKGGADGNKPALIETYALNQVNYGTLYDENGDEYTESEYLVQMLVENYVTDKDKNNWMLAAESGKTVTLMTASSNNTDGYPYRGTAGTYCTVKHGTGYNASSLFTTFGNLILKDITLDGGAVYDENGNPTRDGITLTQAGGLVALMNGADSFGGTGASLTIGENATLQNAYNNGTGAELGGGAVSNSSQSKGKMSHVVNMNGGRIVNCGTSGNGGAIYLAKGTFNMNGGVIENCTASGNGGAVFLKEGTKMTMNAGTIKGNKAAIGAGIYLSMTSELKLSGSPNFGGTAANGANTNTVGTGTGAKRQDIYIAGYLGKKGGNGADKDDPKLAESLIVSGALNLAKGSIWVGAEVQENQEDNHWDTLKQFAKFADELMTGQGENRKVNLSNSNLEKTLEAFRNATATEEYYGATGENIQCIYWDGVSGGRKVILRKVNSSYESVNGKTFAIYKGTSTTAYTPKGETDSLSGLTSGPSGCFWVGDLPYGWYIVEETSPSKYFFIVVTSSGTYGTLETAGGVDRDKVGGYDTLRGAQDAAKEKYEELK